MRLDWTDNRLAHSAAGSGGFEFVVFTGALISVVKRVPAAPKGKVKHHGKTVIHAQQRVATVAEGKALAQSWEDEL